MKKILLFSAILSLFCSCQEKQTDNGPKALEFRFIHPSALTKANAEGFESGDQVGVFMTGAGETLQLAGNFINNAQLSFNGTAWASSRPYYWPDNTSSCDAFAYYPYMEISSIFEQPFSVPVDQSEGCGTFDFLWAKTEGQTYSASPIALSFGHRLSKLKITVAAGGEYGGVLPDEMTVRVLNTVNEGLIDFGEGVVVKNPDAGGKAITCHSLGSHVFEAIVIPQSVNGRKAPLFEVLANGVSYIFSGTISYIEGYQTNLTLVLMSNPGDVKQGIFIDGEYSSWD